MKRNGPGIGISITKQNEMNFRIPGHNGQPVYQPATQPDSVKSLWEQNVKGSRYKYAIEQHGEHEINKKDYKDNAGDVKACPFRP